MLDICLLGTGGMMPLPKRWTTSLLTRYNGSSLLIDCGEGTQIAMKEAGMSFNPVDIICITHFHADHIAGLPGFLLTMGNADRTEPVTIIGPKGLTRVVDALRVIAPELPFKIIIKELTEDFETIEEKGYVIEAFKVTHRVICYGYNIRINRGGRFDVNAAKAADIPIQFWNRLQKGESVETDGRTYTPDMVLGPPLKGLKVTYCTDSRPIDSIAEAATGADLFICEGMYGEDGKEAKAREYKHMTIYDAAKLAARAHVSQLWLTHYSPSMVRPEQYLNKVKTIFENTVMPRDGQSITLDFIDE